MPFRQFGQIGVRQLLAGSGARFLRRKIIGNKRALMFLDKIAEPSLAGFDFRQENKRLSTADAQET
jgi:hypothetical protein